MAGGPLINLYLNKVLSFNSLVLILLFFIRDVCAAKNIKVYQPPYLRSKAQLTAEQAIYKSRIAAAQVHIERSNQRIKLFKILCGRLQTTLIPHVDSILKVICGVINVSSPILADDKFMH